jgi:hypothetical protein
MRIYQTLREAHEAVRQIESTLDDLDRRVRKLDDDAKVWFIRTEPTEQVVDKLTLLETVLGHPMYWFVCWMDERKVAKKWPYNEVQPVSKGKALVGEGLVVLCASAMLGCITTKSPAGVWQYLFAALMMANISIGAYIGGKLTALLMNRLAQIKKAKAERDTAVARLKQIKDIATREGPAGYRASAQESARFREIADICG